MAETIVLDTKIGTTDSVSRSRVLTVADNAQAQADFAAGTPWQVVVRLKSADFTVSPLVALALWVMRSTDGGATWQHFISCTAIGGSQVGRQDVAPLPMIARPWDGVGGRYIVILAQTGSCEVGVGIDVVRP